MIQRIQSLWLLLAAIASFFAVTQPFFMGKEIIDNIPSDRSIPFEGNLFTIILTVIVGLLSFATIFLYKNRKLQMRLTALGMILSIGVIVLYFLEAKKYAEVHYLFSCVFALIVPPLLFLATRGIYNDSKLVKSADRLRP